MTNISDAQVRGRAAAAATGPAQHPASGAGDRPGRRGGHLEAAVHAARHPRDGLPSWCRRPAAPWLRQRKAHVTADSQRCGGRPGTQQASSDPLTLGSACSAECTSSMKFHVCFFKGMLVACYRSTRSARAPRIWGGMHPCCRCIEPTDMMQALYSFLQSGARRDLAGSLGSGGVQQGGGSSRACRWLGSQLLRARGPATQHQRRLGPAACTGHRVTAGSRCAHQVCSCLFPRSSVLFKQHSILVSMLGSASTGNYSEIQTYRY